MEWPYIAGDYTVGNRKASFAVVTCGSHDLPERIIAKEPKLVAIAGSCETENDGIARILQNVVSNSHIRFLVVCGEKVVGHEPGQTLVALHQNGIGDDFRVIGSEGTIPILHPKYFKIATPHIVVERFKKQVEIIDLRGEKDPDKIVSVIRSFSARQVEAYPEQPLLPSPREEKYDWMTALERVLREGEDLRLRGVEPVNTLFHRRKLIVYDIAGVKLGGQRGEYASVLAGTLFFRKDPLVKDGRKGLFDKEGAEKLIIQQAELSEEYGIPSMVHVVGETAEALTKYMFFVADVTDAPIIIDSTSLEARVEATRVAKETGLNGRIIYNSILSVEEKEARMLQEISPIDYAIILAYDFTLEARFKKIDQILSRVKGAVVDNVILDPGVPILGEGSIEAVYSSWALKNHYGYPTAIGIHNLYAGIPPEMKQKMDFSFIYSLPVLYGVDLNLYGPMRNAPRIFRQVAAAEVTVADELCNVLNVMPRPVHPYYQLGKDGT